MLENLSNLHLIADKAHTIRAQQIHNQIDVVSLYGTKDFNEIILVFSNICKNYYIRELGEKFIISADNIFDN